MERVIADARCNNQPAYILVPSDYAQASVTPVEVRPATLKSNEAALKKGDRRRQRAAEGSEVGCRLAGLHHSAPELQKQLRDAIEALGCRFAVFRRAKLGPTYF